MRSKLLYTIFLLQAFIFNLSNVITPRFLSELSLDKYYFGYYSAIWSFGIMVSSPIWGKISTKYGKKNFVILGIAIYALSQLGFYYVSNIFILGVLRLTSGIGVGAIVTLLLSYLILNTGPKVRAKALSYRMAFITLGMTLAYMIGGLVGSNITREMFLYQSLLSVIFIVLIILFMREEKVKSCVFPKQYNLFDSIKFIKHMDKQVLVFLFSITLTTMSFVNLDKFLDLYIIDQGYGVSVLGSVKMVFGLVLIITNFVFVPKLKRFLGNVYVLQTINVMMAVVVMVTLMNNNLLVMLYSVFLLFIILKGIYTTSEQLYLSKVIDKDHINIFVGIRQSFACLGMILGPIIGGHLYTYNQINMFQFNVVCLLLSSIMISYMKLVPKSSKELIYSK